MVMIMKVRLGMILEMLGMVTGMLGIGSGTVRNNVKTY